MVSTGPGREETIFVDEFAAEFGDYKSAGPLLGWKAD